MTTADIALDDPSVARQVAQTAARLHLERTGHAPASVSVVLSNETLVITLHGALSPAETMLATTPAGAAQVQDFHRNLFESSSRSLREEIKRITGVDVRSATAQIETTAGAVVQVFTTGTMVQVFLLAERVSPNSWFAN
jgi:uncharacterized protein YbcI